jgi:DNA-binding PadR family transcriptional regulator
MKRIDRMVLDAMRELTGHAASVPLSTLEIWDEVRANRPWWWLYVSLGAIFVSLDRLEKEGKVYIWFVEQNGTPRKFAALMKAGRA